MANINGPKNTATRKDKPPLVGKHRGGIYSDSPSASQSQKERFIETARKLEADESGEAFERAFGKLILAKTGKSKI